MAWHRRIAIWNWSQKWKFKEGWLFKSGGDLPLSPILSALSSPFEVGFSEKRCGICCESCPSEFDGSLAGMILRWHFGGFVASIFHIWQHLLQMTCSRESRIWCWARFVAWDLPREFPIGASRLSHAFFTLSKVIPIIRLLLQKWGKGWNEKISWSNSN